MTIAGHIELYRAEIDHIIDQGAYIIAYRRIYKPYRAASGAYRTETVYASGSPQTLFIAWRADKPRHHI